MNKRQRRRILESRLRAVRQKRKEIDKEIKRIEPIKERLGTLIAEMKDFNQSNKGKEVKMHQAGFSDKINVNSSTGIWIVRDKELMKDADSVSLTKFYDLVNEVEKPLTMRVQLPKIQMIGADGKEVTFNTGDLLQCAYEGDLHDGKHGFHFANLEPNGEEGQHIYDLVRKKLGLNKVTIYNEQKSIRYLVVDGNFRKVN